MKKKLLFILTAICSYAAMAQVPTYVPTNGLVGYWPFNGNANDESGNSNNGTVSGATLITDRFGNANKAYDFNGLTNYIEIAHNAIFNVTSFTISVWYKAKKYTDNSQGSQRIIISKRESTGWGNSFQFALDSSSNVPGFHADWSINGNSGIYYSNSQLLKVNTWTNILYVHRVDSAFLYLNGQKVLSKVLTGQMSFNTLPIRIGERPNNAHTESSFYGTLDDIGIWNRALNQSEITSLYQGCSSPPTAIITQQSATTFCTGGFVNLNASTGNGYTYQWYKNGIILGGAINSTYVASQAGNYTVVVNSGGCTATSSPITVIVNTSPNSGVTVSGATTICSGNSVTLTSQGVGTYLWSNGAITNAILVNQPGVYSVTVTANGCSSISGTTTIVVNQTPSASIIPVGSTTFCQGGFVTLNATGGNTYQWNTGATSSSINANQSNTYSVIVTANGCSANASQVVTVNPNPVVTLASLTSPININASPVILSGSPSGGSYSGSGVTGASFNPYIAGLGTKYIHYNYTTGAGCSGSATQSTIVDDTTGLVCTSYISVTDTLIINVTTGINSQNNPNTIKVYPNPSSDHIYIDNGNYNLMTGYSYTITNALSQQVFYSLVNQQQFYISLSTFSGNGIYFLTIRDAANNIIQVKKIVLQ